MQHRSLNTDRQGDDMDLATVLWALASTLSISTFILGKIFRNKLASGVGGTFIVLSAIFLGAVKFDELHGNAPDIFPEVFWLILINLVCSAPIYGLAARSWRKLLAREERRILRGARRSSAEALQTLQGPAWSEARAQITHLVETELPRLLAERRELLAVLRKMYAPRVHKRMEEVGRQIDRVAVSPHEALVRYHLLQSARDPKVVERVLAELPKTIELGAGRQVTAAAELDEALRPPAQIPSSSRETS